MIGVLADVGSGAQCFSHTESGCCAGTDVIPMQSFAIATECACIRGIAHT